MRVQRAGAMGMIVLGISSTVSLLVMAMLIEIVVSCFVSMLFAEMT